MQRSLGTSLERRRRKVLISREGIFLIAVQFGRHELPLDSFAISRSSPIARTLCAKLLPSVMIE
jgi:hypothetical protein